MIGDGHFHFKECTNAGFDKEDRTFHNNFNALYMNSYFCSQCGLRSPSTDTGKGHGLMVGQQERFTQLNVIGDQSSSECLQNGRRVNKCFRDKVSSLNVPMVMVSVTSVIYNYIYQMSTKVETKVSVPPGEKIQPRDGLVMSETKQLFMHMHVTSQSSLLKQASAVLEIHIDIYNYAKIICIPVSFRVQNVKDVKRVHNHLLGKSYCYIGM